MNHLRCDTDFDHCLPRIAWDLENIQENGSEWASVDIIEDEKEWLVKADLPEVNKDLIVNRVY